MLFSLLPLKNIFSILPKNDLRKELTLPLIMLLSLLLGALCGCSAKPAPKISFDVERFDFGNVEEGVELKHIFKITNEGNAPLQINDVYSSCGCTTPKLTKSDLQPGESTDLNVIADTSMKQDQVTKEVSVSSNDPHRPIVNIDLVMNVRNMHIGMKPNEEVKIFTDPHCAACHVDQGVGLFGKELFEADCAMCHGEQAQGKVGPALKGPYDNKVYRQHIVQVLSFGSKTKKTMPGYLAGARGPLAKEQIDSIVDYLATLSTNDNRSHTKKQ